MARSAGVEPTTDCLEGSCSIQLSYERTGILRSQGAEFWGNSQLGDCISARTEAEKAEVSVKILSTAVATAMTQRGKAATKGPRLCSLRANQPQQHRRFKSGFDSGSRTKVRTCAAGPSDGHSRGPDPEQIFAAMDDSCLLHCGVVRNHRLRRQRKCREPRHKCIAPKRSRGRACIHQVSSIMRRGQLVRPTIHLLAAFLICCEIVCSSASVIAGVAFLRAAT